MYLFLLFRLVEHEEHGVLLVNILCGVGIGSASFLIVLINGSFGVRYVQGIIKEGCIVHGLLWVVV